MIFLTDPDTHVTEIKKLKIIYKSYKFKYLSNI